MSTDKFKRLSVAILGVAVIGVLINFDEVSAKSGDEKPKKFAEKLKETFNSLDTNQEALAIVKLQNGKKFAGFINEVQKDRLVITDLKTGNAFVLYLAGISKIRLVVIQRGFTQPVPQRISNKAL
jgi:hypothetical protein